MKLDVAKRILEDTIAWNTGTRGGLAEAIRTVLAELDRLQAAERPGAMTVGERDLFLTTFGASRAAGDTGRNSALEAYTAVTTARMLCREESDPQLAAMLREAVGR